MLLLVFFGALYVVTGSLQMGPAYTIPFIVYLGVWPILSALNKDYKIGRAVSYYHTFKKAFISVFIFVSLISLFWLIFDLDALNRSFLLSLFLFLFLWVTIYRVSIHIILDRYRTFGGNIRYALILGYDQLGFNLFKVLEQKPHYGIHCKGFYGDASINNTKFPVIGSIEAFFERDLTEIDILYVSERISKNQLDRITNRADEQLVKVKLLPDFGPGVAKTFSLRRFGDIPVVDVNNLPLDTLVNQVVKRSFDIVFSLVMVFFVLSWLYPLLGALIKLESKGPVLFKQKRHGKDNQWFWCYKFRTMVINPESDSKWASPDDPRVTRIGAFLRRTSLDEFPQFINVLFGSMSIVGPRPHPISLNEAYIGRVEKYVKRHASKPGVTGLAQAMGYRGEIKNFHQMSSRVRLDRFYLQNWSFLLDVKIIFLTLLSIMRGTDNAY